MNTLLFAMCPPTDAFMGGIVTVITVIMALIAIKFITD